MSHWEWGQEELRDGGGGGWWGHGACWVTWEQLQILWAMGPICPRCLPGLLEDQAGSVSPGLSAK